MSQAWLPDVSEHWADLPGLRMHYMASGPEAGRPVLLLHGFPEFWYSWRFQMPALARAGYRVIVPDQRGYNLTDKQGPYDVRTLVQDLVNLQQALGISATHVVGHDWGGVVAWAFAAIHPDRTHKLVVMNGPHPAAYLDACKRLSRQLFRSWYIYLFQAPWLPERLIERHGYRALDRMFRGLRRKGMTAEDIERYKEACARPGALSAMIGWYRALPRQVVARGGVLPLPPIGPPTCVIWGERDPALDVSCNAALERYVSDLRIHYIPSGTHWVHMDHPDEVNALMLTFLRE